MSRIKNSQYVYAVSRIRVIESRLLSREQMGMMIDAATREEALKILLDSDYGYRETDMARVHDYERLLEEEHKKLYKLFREISPQPEIFQIFLQPYDFNNIKMILKAEFAGIEDFSGLLKDKGSIELKKLEVMMRDRKFDEMPSVMRQAVEEAISDFYHTRDPQTVDLILDRACYGRMRQMADSYKNCFLRDFIAGTVDILNVNIILRLEKMKKDEEFAKRALLPGGYVPIEILIQKSDKPIDVLVGLLKHTSCGEVAQRALENYKSTGRKIRTESMLNDFINIFIARGRYLISGLEPLIGYMLAKEREIRNVRAVMAGKSNRLSGEKIRERLMGLYA